MTGAFLHPFAKPARDSFIELVRGEGSVLWDRDGNEYIDAMASLWYCNVGHGRSEIADAVASQIPLRSRQFHGKEVHALRDADTIREAVPSLAAHPSQRVKGR